MSDRGVDLLERRVVRLLTWMKKGHDDMHAMSGGLDEVSEWCRDEAERIDEHMKTVRDLYEAAKR